MNTQPEALRLADALEDTDGAHDHDQAAAELRRLHEENQTLKRCLFQMQEAAKERLSHPEPEPVAYGVLDADGQIDWTVEYPFSNEPGWPGSVPLYTASPKREWVGLTDDEIWDCYTDQGKKFYLSIEEFYLAIEAKLKEKNT